MEKTEVMAEVITNPAFTKRIRATAAKKAYAVLQEATPDAGQLAWAKLAISSGYDAWTEALLILAEVLPATPAAAYDAADSVYDAQLLIVLDEVIKAKEL